MWINSHGGVHPMIPFGGVKQSGYGLEFGAEGLKSVVGPPGRSTADTYLRATAPARAGVRR